MADHPPVRRRSLRAVSVAGLLSLAGLPTALPAGAQEAQFSDQAEWAQGYDADARQSVQRSTTPVLSQATFEATERAIEQYRQIVARGGWARVPTGRTLKLGANGPAVVALRKRLIVSGDLDGAAGNSPVFDSYVDVGVKHFQARHGFQENGIVNADVLTAMNVSADTRMHQLETNLVRLKSFSGNLGERYVMANIPAESVETVENGVVATHHRAGVGRIDRQSPVMQTRALDINFNPYWHVPPSLIKKDLIPKMLADPNYLNDHRIHVFKGDQEIPSSAINWHSNEATQYTYKEDPGTENSLGVVRININNPYGVYMHDTPEKGVFGDDNRFVSSGCIRVQNVRDYVQWLLKDTPGWSRPQIDEAIRSGSQVNVKLAQPVPVYWVYVTAWAYPNGVVEFRDDIYQRDGFSNSATGSIGRPEPQGGGVRETSYGGGRDDGADEGYEPPRRAASRYGRDDLDAAPDER